MSQRNDQELLILEHVNALDRINPAAQHNAAALNAVDSGDNNGNPL
jgi:hypothetical protein